MENTAMATLGEYGSLLQLGFGIGVGLSLFRAPMEVLSAKVRADLNSEVDVLANVHSVRANEIKSELSDLNLEFVRTSSTLDRFHFPFMIASILVALINWGLLAAASADAPRKLTYWEEWGLLFVSGPIYLVISAVLAYAAWQLLRPIQTKLDAIRSR
jgi:hypothetical protein